MDEFQLNSSFLLGKTIFYHLKKILYQIFRRSLIFKKQKMLKNVMNQRSKCLCQCKKCRNIVRYLT